VKIDLSLIAPGCGTTKVPRTTLYLMAQSGANVTPLLVRSLSTLKRWLVILPRSISWLSRNFASIEAKRSKYLAVSHGHGLCAKEGA
jgi:hypothetical protein